MFLRRHCVGSRGHSVDWYLMTEDLPHPDNRVAIDGPDIVLHWQRTNMTAHRRLVAKARDVFRGGRISS